jgi:cytoskeletal protein RodZ
MSTVAEQLRHAREAQNLTVQQVAEITKMRSDHIRALEEGNFEVFSAPVYIRGFVRTCSTLLKLDVPKVMAALDEELSEHQKFSEPPPFTDTRGGPLYFITLILSKVDWRKSLIALGAIAVLGIIISVIVAWRHHVTTDPLAGVKPGIYHSTQSVSGETLPLPTNTHHQ